MSDDQHAAKLLRTRWSAIGAAVAITLGAGGIGIAQAGIDSGDKPVTVTVDATRIVDTRFDIGLAGAFAKDTPRDVQVTGEIDVVDASGVASEKATVVPAGASGVLVNVTVVTPTADGFLSLRPAGATGKPTTSTVNFIAGSIEPNAATVDLSADGRIQTWVFLTLDAGTADVIIDVVGYTIDHNHDDRYYTEGETDAKLVAKANSADVYTKGEVDSALAPLANSADVYTKGETYTQGEVDSALAPLANSADVYTKSEVDAVVAAIPDTRDQEFSRTFFNIPAGSFGFQQATCPGGMMAISGGFGMLAPPQSGTITMQQSGPASLVNGVPAAWLVDVHNNGGVDIEGFIDLICVSVG